MQPSNTSPKRQLGLFSVTSIVVANMIGVGIFTTSGLLMGDLKDPWIMLLLWLIGGCLAFFGALSYGELGAAMPMAGGEYAFLSRLFSPLLGFLSGWVSFMVGFSAPIAASAIGFSEYLLNAYPLLPEFSGVSHTIIVKILGCFVILLFSWIHSRGLSMGTGIQNVLTILKVLLILGLIIAGFFFGTGDFSHFEFTSASNSEAVGLKTYGLALMWILFAYSGWNAATYIGSEIRDPQKNLPASLFLGTALVALLYLLLNALFIYAVPSAEMAGVIAIGGLAVEYLFGEVTNILISVLIAFALFSSLSAFIIIGPRVYYAMAKDGLFFSFVGRMHKRYDVPSNAIWIQALIAIILVLSGTFDQILTYMGFALGIFPILAVYGIFRLRKRQASVKKFPGFPWVQILFMASSIFILTFAFMERPVESSIAIGTVLIGIPIYYLFKRQDAG